MNLNEYQKQAKKTAFYPEKHQLIYPTLGLAGESGEVANVVQKLMRDKATVLDDADRKRIAFELGDCLWFMAAIASDIGYDLDLVAQMNLDKLADRMARGKIGGSGDNR